MIEMQEKGYEIARFYGGSGKGNAWRILLKVVPYLFFTSVPFMAFDVYYSPYFDPYEDEIILMVVLLTFAFSLPLFLVTRFISNRMIKKIEEPIIVHSNGVEYNGKQYGVRWPRYKFVPKAIISDHMVTRTSTNGINNLLLLRVSTTDGQTYSLFQWSNNDDGLRKALEEMNAINVTSGEPQYLEPIRNDIPPRSDQNARSSNANFFCKYCGSRLVDDAAFCGKCGRKV